MQIDNGESIDNNDVDFNDDGKQSTTIVNGNQSTTMEKLMRCSLREENEQYLILINPKIIRGKIWYFNVILYLINLLHCVIWINISRYMIHLSKSLIKLYSCHFTNL